MFVIARRANYLPMRGICHAGSAPVRHSARPPATAMVPVWWDVDVAPPRPRGEGRKPDDARTRTAAADGPGRGGGQAQPRPTSAARRAAGPLAGRHPARRPPAVATCTLLVHRGRPGGHLHRPRAARRGRHAASASAPPATSPRPSGCSPTTSTASCSTSRCPAAAATATRRRARRAASTCCGSRPAHAVLALTAYGRRRARRRGGTRRRPGLPLPRRAGRPAAEPRHPLRGGAQARRHAPSASSPSPGCGPRRTPGWSAACCPRPLLEGSDLRFAARYRPGRSPRAARRRLLRHRPHPGRHRPRDDRRRLRPRPGRGGPRRGAADRLARADLRGPVRRRAARHPPAGAGARAGRRRDLRDAVHGRHRPGRPPRRACAWPGHPVAADRPARAGRRSCCRTRTAARRSACCRAPAGRAGRWSWAARGA